MPHQPSDPPADTRRLALKPEQMRTGYVDGGWWHSDELAAEVVELGAVLTLAATPGNGDSCEILLAGRAPADPRESGPSALQRTRWSAVGNGTAAASTSRADDASGNGDQDNYIR
jgi:hypothetical protein